VSPEPPADDSAGPDYPREYDAAANQIAVVPGPRGGWAGHRLDLAQQGATVLAVARSPDKLEQLTRRGQAAELPGTVVAAASLTDRRPSKTCGTRRRRGQDDRHPVNNAGITRDSLLMNMEDEQFDDGITANPRASSG